MLIDYSTSFYSFTRYIHRYICVIITVVLNLQAYRQTDRKIIFARSMQLFYMIIYVENFTMKIMDLSICLCGSITNYGL